MSTLQSGKAKLCSKKVFANVVSAALPVQNLFVTCAAVGQWHLGLLIYVQYEGLLG